MSRLIAAVLVLLAFPVLADTAVLKDGDVLRGHFVQERHMQGFAAPLRSEGSFVVAPGRGLIWRAETPFAITTVVTPAGLVQSVDGAETSRLSTSRIPFLASLYDMLTAALAGDWGGLEGAFTVARTGDRVFLTPLRADDPNIPSIKARLGRFVEEVEITKPGGDRDRLVFTDQLLNARPLDAAEAAALK